MFENSALSEFEAKTRVHCDICGEPIGYEPFLRIDNGLTVCNHCYYIDSIDNVECDEEEM